MHLLFFKPCLSFNKKGTLQDIKQETADFIVWIRFETFNVQHNHKLKIKEPVGRRNPKSEIFS